MAFSSLCTISILFYKCGQERNNLIFKKWCPNFNTTTDKALSYCSDFDQTTRIKSREYSKFRNSHPIISVHIDASWNLKN